MKRFALEMRLFEDEMHKQVRAAIDEYVTAAVYVQVRRGVYGPVSSVNDVVSAVLYRETRP